MRRSFVRCVLWFVVWATQAVIAVGQEGDSGLGYAARNVKFRVRVELTVDASHANRGRLEASIARELPRRLQAALGGPGSVDVELAVVRSYSLLAEPSTASAQSVGEVQEAMGYDKVLHLRIVESYSGFVLAAQDYDVATQFLCPLVQRDVRQPSRVVDGCIEALLAAYSPTAEFQQIPDDSDHVLLRERLSASTLESAASTRLQEGDVLVPVLRRSTSIESEVQTQIIPWTFLVVERGPSRAAGTQQPVLPGAGSAGENQPGPPTDNAILCRVESHSRRALGIRRRGRIEQLAVAVRPKPAPLTLQLVTQSEPRKPLVGCSVYLRESRSDDVVDAKAVGVSDLDGFVELAPTRRPVHMLWIKSGELLLAKLPVVWGLSDVLEVPLPEDPARIRAAADLRALRTDLVDLVARRNILLARGSAAVADGNLALARTLAGELDQLPTRAQFNQRIDRVAQSAKSADPLAQARIDRLVEETRSVLGQFLDPRELSELRSAINNAAN